MNDKVTVSTLQLFKMFPDAESGRKYLEKRLWPQGAQCPTCKAFDRITSRKGGYYRCNACKLDFTVRTGTIFERSHVPLHKWVYAMYLLVTARKGISSPQLSKQIDITQKSAWFVLQRLREACGNDKTMLKGIVEVDETYVAGKEGGKHSAKKLLAGRGTVGKIPVIGIRERGGRTVAEPVDGTDTNALHRVINENVEIGSSLHTDEHAGCKGLDSIFFKHYTINHSAGGYTRRGDTTNGIENMWATIKCGLHGVYHHASDKHLAHHVDKFSSRLNDGNVSRHTLKSLDGFVDATAGRRITYQQLIA
jgi:transposase-like protein